VRSFEDRYAAALADPDVRNGLTAFQRGWRDNRDHAIATLEEQEGRSFATLRAELAAIKDGVLADWERYLDEFTTNATRAGATITAVATPGEANAAITRLLHDAGVDLVVKGKSMVSEEMGLNHHLEAEGITPIETDLGEWILQLAGETPSHLVMPAIHKRKERVAELFTRVLDRPFPPDDIDRMVKAARTELRERFLAGGAGLSGANALVAEGGAVMLVCNEGNNRMSVALPRIHLVTAGIEKLVPTFADAMLQVRLLARSATAQPITVYTNFVTGPRPGQEQHIILLDNGRRAMAADPDVAAALRCIRCGACANVCPPYGVVGGHAFGHVYTGAIGLVNTAFHHGIEAAAGPQSLCVSCGACATVCPVEIPLPTQILEVRSRVAEAGVPTPGGRLTRLGLAAFQQRWLVDVGLRAAGLVTSPLREDGVTRIPARLAGTQSVAQRASWRTPPAIPVRPARDRMRRGALPEPPRLASQPLAGRRVLLFLQCLSDRLAPDIPLSAARLLRAAGANVIVPRAQHCCGLPAYDAGAPDTARALLRQTLDTLDGADDVVTPASSCLAMLGHEGPYLLRDEDEADRSRAAALARRTYDLVGYLTTGPGRLPAGSLDNGDRTPVTVHRFCQASTTLQRKDAVERLLRHVAGVPVVALPEAATCCGFGGSTSVRHPELAAGILERKLENVDRTAVSVLITDNPGCILHLRGGMHASDRPVRVLHLAEYLAGRLPDTTNGPTGT
jgi:L-lactate dehydrogenase complex protein LldF